MLGQGGPFIPWHTMCTQNHRLGVKWGMQRSGGLKTLWLIYSWVHCKCGMGSRAEKEVFLCFLRNRCTVPSVYTVVMPWYLLITSWMWANSVLKWPRRPAAFWLVSEMMLPAGLGKWCTFLSTCTLWGCIWSIVLSFALLHYRKDIKVLDYVQSRAMVKGLENKFYE